LSDSRHILPNRHHYDDLISRLCDQNPPALTDRRRRGRCHVRRGAQTRRRAPRGKTGPSVCGSRRQGRAGAAVTAPREWRRPPDGHRGAFSSLRVTVGASGGLDPARWEPRPPRPFPDCSPAFVVSPHQHRGGYGGLSATGSADIGIVVFHDRPHSGRDVTLCEEKGGGMGQGDG
jgi:hypothetical protein